jgi:hypothetical protein
MTAQMKGVFTIGSWPTYVGDIAWVHGRKVEVLSYAPANDRVDKDGRPMVRARLPNGVVITVFQGSLELRA